MRWRWLGSSAVILGSLVGCIPPERPQFVRTAQDSLVEAMADPTAATTRLQKPEGDKTVAPISFLDMRPQRPAELPADRRAVAIWATVNGRPILEDEVRESSHYALIEANRLPDPLRGVRQKEILTQERDRLIEQELLLQDAYDRLSRAGKQYLEKLREAAGKQFDRQLKLYKTFYSLKTDEELKKFLREQGLSLEGIRRQKEREFIATEYVRSRIMPIIDNITPAQILEEYRKHPEQFQGVERVEWQDIFIDASKHASQQAARQFAEQLAARARSGEDFVKLAEEYDNGYSRTIKGAGAGQSRGQINPPEVEPHLFQLRDGEVGPIVELPTGFHIIRVAKREHGGKKPFDEKIQSQIRNQLRNEAGTKEMKRIIDELKRKATIEMPATLP